MIDDVLGYMCMIDWDHELRGASDGARVYPSLDDLKADHECWRECGVVEVRVSLIRQVHAPEEILSGVDDVP